jgi:putative glycosyltransferase
MKLSIVATLFRSAPYIHEFVERTSKAAEVLVAEDYEIILVNDGSPDDSLQIAVKLTEANQNLIVVDLSRNFGHHKAMMTGLDHAKGERIFLIDSDLEEEPEWLIDFSQEMLSQSADVVYGVQKTRKGKWFERWSGDLFWKIIRTLSRLSLPSNIVTARIMSRRYVDALLLHRESEIFMAGLLYITGFKQRPHTVVKRNTSKSTYTFSRKLGLLINSITSFSNTPLIWIFYVGMLIVVLSLIYSAFLFFNYFFYSKPLAGFTSLMISIWLLGGLIISFIGVVGIYLAKVFSEVKRRPHTIIRHIYRKNNLNTINSETQVLLKEI